MDTKLREYFHRVESRDVDFLKRATIMAFGDYILHTAGEDADLNGFGVRELNAKYNSSWVLTRMAVEVRRIPVEHEQLRINTWVSDVSRVMTTRNFLVYGAGDRLIAEAVTNWAMIDLSTRRPMDLHQLDAYEGMTQDVPAPIELPRKLASPSITGTSQHRVVYSDVDFNCHANSMKYLQWAVDTMPLEVLEKKRFARVDINFIQESRHGELLTIAEQQPDYLFEIMNEAGKPICRIALQMV